MRVQKLIAGAKSLPIGYWIWSGAFLILAIFILRAPYFFTIDGPAHHYSVQIVTDLLMGDPYYADYFNLNAFPVPYWGAYLPLALLNLVFNPFLADKLFFILLLSCCCWGLARILQTLKAPWLIQLLFLPLLLNKMLFFGYVNFYFSISLTLIAMAYWLRWKETYSWRGAIFFGLLTLGIYFSHPVGFAIYGLLVLLFSSVKVAIKWRASSFKSSVRVVWLTALAVAPAVALFLGYFLLLEGTGLDQTGRYNLLSYGRMLVFLEPLITYSHLEGSFTIWFGLVLWVLLGAALGFRLQSKAPLHISDAWWLAVACMGCLVVVVPDYLSAGGGLTDRFFWWLLLVVGFAIASKPLPRVMQTAIALVASVVFWQQLSSYSKVQADIGGLVDDYRTAEAYIPSYATVLPLAHEVQWFDHHIHNYITYTAARMSYDNTVAWLGSSAPVQWTEENSPSQFAYDSLSSNYLINGCANLEGYTARTSKRIDFIIIWGPKDFVDESACYVETLRQVATGYELIHTSPKGLLRLYRRKDFRRDNS